VKCVRLDPVDWIELLIHGRPEDGLLEAETCSHPRCVFNIILELCLTDFSVDTPLLNKEFPETQFGIEQGALLVPSSGDHHAPRH
jgi:hypothetical protein